MLKIVLKFIDVVLMMGLLLGAMAIAINNVPAAFATPDWTENSSVFWLSLVAIWLIVRETFFHDIAHNTELKL